MYYTQTITPSPLDSHMTSMTYKCNTAGKLLKSNDQVSPYPITVRETGRHRRQCCDHVRIARIQVRMIHVKSAVQKLINRCLSFTNYKAFRNILFCGVSIFPSGVVLPLKERREMEDKVNSHREIAFQNVLLLC